MGRDSATVKQRQCELGRERVDALYDLIVDVIYSDPGLPRMAQLTITVDGLYSEPTAGQLSH